MRLLDTLNVQVVYKNHCNLINCASSRGKLQHNHSLVGRDSASSTRRDRDAYRHIDGPDFSTQSFHHSHPHPHPHHHHHHHHYHHRQNESAILQMCLIHRMRIIFLIIKIPIINNRISEYAESLGYCSPQKPKGSTIIYLLLISN